MSERIKSIRFGPPPTQPDVLTVDEAALLLRMCRNSLYTRLKEPGCSIPHVRVGRKILIPRQALLKWAEGPPPESRQAAPEGPRLRFG